MKILFKIAFIVLMLLNLCACTDEVVDNVDVYTKIKDTHKFLVGVNNNSKPFGYVDENNVLKGFDVDLMRALSKEIFETDSILEFVPVTPSSRILSLNSGEVDAVISTMTITEDRMRLVDFSKPYYMTGQAILVHNESQIRSGKDLNSKKIGIVLGTTAETNIRYIASNALIRAFKTYKDAFHELEMYNIDAISTDDVILRGITSNNKKYRILPDRYSTELYGIAFRKDTYSQNLKTAINEALAKLEKNGTIEELEHRYNVKYKR